MASIPEVPLAELCQTAEPATLMAFVGDLYEARGLTVDRQGDRRLVVSDGDRKTRLAVGHSAEDLESGLVTWADTVVVTDGTDTVDGDVDVIGPTDLHEQLAYAIERPVARGLLRSHFGWSPPESTGSQDPDNDIAPAGHSSSRPFAGRSRILLAVVLVLAVAGGVTVAVADQIGGGEQPVEAADGGAELSTPTPTDVATAAEGASPTPTEQTATPAAEGGSEQEGEQFVNLPPGVDQSGTIDNRQLSNAQESLLANRSYRLSVTYQEFVGGEPTGLHTETLQVENATRYRGSVSHRGRLRTSPFSVVEKDVYADGSVRYERVNESDVEQTVLLSYDRFADDYALYLLWFLDVRDSSIVDQQSTGGTTTTFLATDENPEPTIKNTTGSVVVTQEGLIKRARWAYDISGTPAGDDNVSVVFELRISDVGETTVSEPDWMNATADD
ncbi:MAG: hypothetical protein V5A39_13905 [Haloarculaceae archaeon]